MAPNLIRNGLDVGVRAFGSIFSPSFFLDFLCLLGPFYKAKNISPQMRLCDNWNMVGHCMTSQRHMLSWTRPLCSFQSTSAFFATNPLTGLRCFLASS